MKKEELMKALEDKTNCEMWGDSSKVQIVMLWDECPEPSFELEVCGKGSLYITPEELISLKKAINELEKEIQNNKGDPNDKSGNQAQKTGQQ